MIILYQNITIIPHGIHICERITCLTASSSGSQHTQVARSISPPFDFRNSRVHLEYHEKDREYSSTIILFGSMPTMGDNILRF